MKTRTRVLDLRNLKAEAWANLRQFSDSRFCSEIIREQHGLKPGEHVDNVRKQAQQVSYCLRQAEEYFNAATAVGLVTKPNLLYYGMLSLALANILLRRTGDSSLDKLREKYRRHGLDLIPITALDPEAGLEEILKVIGCKPCKGTFEVWYETLTPDPVLGEHRITYPVGIASTETKILLENKTIPFSSIEGTRLNSLELLENIPDMYRFLGYNQLDPRACRGDFRLHFDERASQYAWTCIAHATASEQQRDALIEQIRVQGGRNDLLSVNKQDSAFVAHVRIPKAEFEKHKVEMPDGRRSLSAQTFLYERQILTNEAAGHYALMYCLSMLVRYYPDQWIRLIERQHRAVNVFAYFLDVSQVKFPLLILNEMSQTFHFVE